MISTRGRYALRVMIDIATNQHDGYVPMKDVALRQGLSLKYLEQILPPLTKNGLLVGIQGKGGGYRLTREPKDYHMSEVLSLTEKDLAPVGCLKEGAPVCERKGACKTITFWEGLDNVIKNYLESYTLADFL